MGLGAREYYGISMASTLLGVYLAFVIIPPGNHNDQCAPEHINLNTFLLCPKSLAAKPGDQQAK